MLEEVSMAPEVDGGRRNLKKTATAEVGERDHRRRFEASRDDSFRGEVQGDEALLVVVLVRRGDAQGGGAMAEQVVAMEGSPVACRGRRKGEERKLGEGGKAEEASRA
jgi:cell division protein FtsI/penicillin-binding protein 2